MARYGRQSASGDRLYRVVVLHGGVESNSYYGPYQTAATARAVATGRRRYAAPTTEFRVQTTGTNWEDLSLPAEET